jgi:fructokinase
MASSFDVAGTGFTVLDRLYSGSDKMSEALGGSCGNVLVSLAMLSRTVAPVLALGRDEVGDQLVETFETAGADTRFIARREEIASPILAQQLDLISGQHWFSFVCPETDERLPRFTSIGTEEVELAFDVLNGCSVFYADRLSEAIVDAMEAASTAGALVYFEPSAVDDDALFARALKLTRILKYSSDRLENLVTASEMRADAIAIVTHGADGLEVRQRGISAWCKAIQAPRVRDTCGSGDMVTVGVIDWILETMPSLNYWTPQTLMGGVLAGQRLAAANCAFAGARGFFERHDRSLVRSVLAGTTAPVDLQMDLFD